MLLSGVTARLAVVSYRDPSLRFFFNEEQSAMAVKLTPQIEAMIEEKVQAGKYNDASEVVRESLRLLEERERLERLRAVIAIGDAQIARGGGINLTAESLDQLKREAEEEDRLSLPISSDAQLDFGCR
jgi:antitoxin ParD1/3/4